MPTKETIRKRFIQRTHDDWFEGLGRQLENRTYDENHVYVWIGYEHVMGYTPGGA